MFRDPQLVKEIEKYSKKRSLAKEETLVQPGDDILYIPIVLKGSLRVIRQDEGGQEVFLYHLYPGQACAMALTCCQAGKKSPVRVIAETPAEVMLVPVAEIEHWYEYPEWKAFVSSNYNNRFEELLQVIDLIAFSNMDKQLQHYLGERSKALNTRLLEITHQQIADELHTHREAVSRLLRVMEKKKLVRLGRNNIEVLFETAR
jgi:CRP/FNR family transcriptional regulator, anaerobic regulatory protein